MLIVGLVSTREEQYEIRFIAEMAIIGERVRYLGNLSRQQENTNKKK